MEVRQGHPAPIFACTQKRTVFHEMKKWVARPSGKNRFFKSVLTTLLKIKISKKSVRKGTPLNPQNNRKRLF